MKILFLTHRLPYAPNRGDRVRAYHLLRSLTGWADVHLVSLVHDTQEASKAAGLRAIARSVTTVRAPRARNLARALIALPTTQPLTHVLLDGPGFTESVREVVRRERPDLILAYCSGVARVMFDPALADVPVVLDMVDVDSEKWRQLAATARWPWSSIYHREARLLSGFEQRAAIRARRTLVVTQAEAASLRALAPSAQIDVISNGVDADFFRPPTEPAASQTVVFCGVMDYRPNGEAAEWLAHFVWPLVRRSLPDARLQIVGAHPTAAVRGLHDAAAGIEVTGEVPDVRRYLWQSAVAAAPLITARGIQNKVLEAIAAGVPVVVSPAVMRGLPKEVQPAVTVGGSADEFAHALLTLLHEPPESRRQRANRVDLAKLSWNYCLRELRTVLESAAESS